MLSMVLRANNSTGIQNLFFDRQEDGTVSPCLVGQYGEQYIQIDFDDLEDKDLDDLITFLKHRRDDNG